MYDFTEIIRSFYRKLDSEYDSEEFLYEEVAEDDEGIC